VTARLRKRDRIREHLIALINSRAIGQAIPSERQLAADLGVSRPTLRAVVDELIKDGWLVREHGRGMFVGAPKIAQEILAVPGAGGNSYPPAPGTWTSRVLDYSVVPAGMTIGSKLRVEAGRPVLRIARQRLVNDEPMALETIHVLNELVPGMTAADIERSSFYLLLRERFDVIPTQAEQIHEATTVDTLEAALLSLSVGDPVLTLERVTSDQHGRLFEYTRAVYRGDRYRLISKLTLTDTTEESVPSITPTKIA
jgi:GntR family transcriptional regulator